MGSKIPSFVCKSKDIIVALPIEEQSLGGKVTPPAPGFEGGVAKVPLGDVLLLLSHSDHFFENGKKEEQ